MSYRKPRAIKSKGSCDDSLSAEFLDDPHDIFRIGSWDGDIGLTLTEAVKLLDWLSRAIKYHKQTKKNRGAGWDT